MSSSLFSYVHATQLLHFYCKYKDIHFMGIMYSFSITLWNNSGVSMSSAVSKWELKVRQTVTVSSLQSIPLLSNHGDIAPSVVFTLEDFGAR